MARGAVWSQSLTLAHIFQSAAYGRLIYTLIFMSDRLLTQANPDLHLPPPPELRRELAEYGVVYRGNFYYHFKAADE